MMIVVCSVRELANGFLRHNASRETPSRIVFVFLRLVKASGATRGNQASALAMSALRFVRATITLYLSKSVRFLRAACLASFLPHADAAHFPSTSAALSAAANASLEGDFSSRSTTREVTARRRSEITQRWMPGASTRTCDDYERVVWVLRRSAIAKGRIRDGDSLCF